MATYLRGVIIANYAEKVTGAGLNKTLSQPFMVIAEVDSTIVFRMKEGGSTVSFTLSAGQEFPVAIYELVSATGTVLIGY